MVYGVGITIGRGGSGTQGTGKSRDSFEGDQDDDSGSPHPYMPPSMTSHQKTPINWTEEDEAGFNGNYRRQRRLRLQWLRRTPVLLTASRTCHYVT